MRQEPGAFVRMPMIVLKSSQWAALSPHGVKLLMDLASQCGLGKNGVLSVAWTLMIERGWKSRDTLNKARKELLDKNWIVLTRQGGRHQASLYALTFFHLDDSSKIEIPRSDFRKDAWARTPTENRPACPASRVSSPRIDTPAVPEQTPEDAH